MEAIKALIEKGNMLSRKHVELLLELIQQGFMTKSDLETFQHLLTSLYLKIEVSNESDLKYKEWVLTCKTQLDNHLLKFTY